MGDREVIVRLRADISQYQRAMAEASAQTSVFGRETNKLGGSGGPLQKTENQAKRTGNEIDKLSGRLRVMTDALLIGAPALTAFGAGAVGGIVALSAELGAAVSAVGVTVLAVKGLGDGLKALDAYQLEPTKENLAKLNEEMGKLGPSGAEFVRFLDSIEPNLKSLQNAAREGLLPGAEQGIDALLQRLPELRKIIRLTATEVGNLAAGGGKAVAGEGFDAFFKYLRTDGIKILDDTAKTAGNLAQALGNVFVGFGPMSSDFSGGLLKFSQGLEKASENLGTSAGFQQFVSYIETEGPHALETLGSLANAFLQIVEATAPLGGPVLEVIGKMADIIAKIADSDIGTPIFAGLAALALLNRAMALTASLQKATFGGPAIAAIKGQASALEALPAAFRESTAAQEALTAAQAQYAAEARVYSAQLQAQNRLRAQGFTMSAEAEARLADSLSRVELANYGVTTATERSTVAQKEQAAVTGRMTSQGLKAGAATGALALAMSGVADSAGLSNTAMLSLAGPWGAAAGFALDLWHATDGLDDAMKNLKLAEASGDADALAAALKGTNSELDKANANTILGTGAFGSFAGGIVNTIAPTSNLEKFMGALTGKTGDLSDEADKAQAQLERLAGSNDRVANAARNVVGPMRDFRVASEQSSEAATEQAAAIEDAVKAMRDQRAEASRALNAQLNYQAAIDDASQAIKDNGKNFDITTEKGRANRQTLYALADGWNAQSDAAKNAKGSLKAARDGFIDTAEQMGATAGQAKKLADRLFEIPPKRTTEINLTGIDNATNKAVGLKAILDGLHSKDINIALHYQTLGNRPSAPLPGGQGSADGSTVPKTGMGYADRHPYLLADGEEVISNRFGQADRNRGLLKAINAGRMADGGSTGGDRRGGGSDVSIFINGLISPLKGLKAALEAETKAVDKAKQSRDDLVSAEQSFMSAVGGAYAKADLFSGGLSEFDTGAQANANDSAAAQAALTAASANGLDGPLYQALAASGNLTLLQEFAGLSAAQIQIRENEFSSQSNAQGSLGSAAADQSGLVQAIKDQNHELREAARERRQLQQAVNHLEAQAKKIGKNVEDGARAGIADRDKRTATRRRTG